MWIPILKNVRYNKVTEARDTALLCILLTRLAYPSRSMDLWQMFGQHPSEISLIFNATLQMVYQNKIHLEYVNNVYWMQVDYLYSYAHTVSDKGTALDACIGFMDGSTKPIARLTENLSVTFSGHKRVHCLRFQSLLLPNGLIGHMSSPLEGRRHDAILLWESDILGQLQQLYRHDRRPFTVYGDPAFPAQKHFISPIKRQILTDQERGFNTSMSVMCGMGFNDIVSNFRFCWFQEKSGGFSGSQLACITLCPFY